VSIPIPGGCYIDHCSVDFSVPLPNIASQVPSEIDVDLSFSILNREIANVGQFLNFTKWIGDPCVEFIFYPCHATLGVKLALSDTEVFEYDFSLENFHFGFCNKQWLSDSVYVSWDDSNRALQLCKRSFMFVDFCLNLSELLILDTGFHFCPGFQVYAPVGSNPSITLDCLTYKDVDQCAMNQDCNSCTSAGCQWCPSRGDCRSTAFTTDSCGGCPGAMYSNCTNPLLPQEVIKQEYVASFKEFDPNGDGSITYAEYVTITSKWTKKESVIKATFQKMDSNGDGVISLSEYVNYKYTALITASL